MQHLRRPGGNITGYLLITYILTKSEHCFLTACVRSSLSTTRRWYFRLILLCFDWFWKMRGRLLELGLSNILQSCRTRSIAWYARDFNFFKCPRTTRERENAEKLNSSADDISSTSVNDMKNAKVMNSVYLQFTASWHPEALKKKIYESYVIDKFCRTFWSTKSNQFRAVTTSRTLFRQSSVSKRDNEI